MSFTRNIRPQLSFKDVYFITFFFVIDDFCFASRKVRKVIISSGLSLLLVSYSQVLEIFQ